MNLADLRRRRAEKVAELEKLASGELTDETRSAFDTVEAEIKALDDDIKRAERIEDVRRSAATAEASAAAAAAAAAATTITTVPATVAEQRDIGIDFGSFVRAYAMSAFSIRSGAGRIINAAEAAAELYGERHPVTVEAARAQTLSENAGGGFLVPQTYAAGIIGLFGPNTVVRSRAQVVPGNASYIKGKTGASVGYVGENEQGGVTGVTFGLIDMKEKDISAILPISKKLLRNTAFGVEAYCRDELVRAAGEFEDRKFLYGTGVGKEVTGYAYAIPGANQFNAADKTAPTNAEVRTELRKAIKLLTDANVPLEANGPAWLMHPSVKLYLEDLYQGDVKAFPTLEGPNPTLRGYPVATSTQITGPAGTGGDIFFGAHKFAMIGDSVTMSLSTSDQASFKDADGNQVNLWAQGMMAIKLDMSHDFALRYEQGFARIKLVKWGQ